MTFRLLFSFALLCLPTTGYAADCLEWKGADDVVVSQNTECGSLILRKREDDAPRLKDRISAIYVEIEQEQSEAERLYNTSIRKKVDGLPWTRIIDKKITSGQGEVLKMVSFYRSSHFISAQYAEWNFSGYGHGREAINIDVMSGRSWYPVSWFYLDEAADACWHQFFASPNGGEPFRSQHPLGTAIQEFAKALRDPGAWSFSLVGVNIQFGPLMGAAAGQFSCHLANKEASTVALKGVTIPP